MTAMFCTSSELKLIVLILCYLNYSHQTSTESDTNTYGITDSYIPISENVPGAGDCYKLDPCDNATKYRTIDGSCNNLLKNSKWGSAMTVYFRLLPAHYQDGQYEIRKAKDGGDLPNVREISAKLYPDLYDPDMQNSLAVVLWGQVLAHDTALSNFPPSGSCCPNGQFPESPIAQCSSISVSKNDSFYSQYNVTCMPYTRVDTSQSIQNCSLHPHQSVSHVTHWVDLSILYGNTDNESMFLRELQGGKLKVEVVNGEDILPRVHEPQEFCRITSANQSCLITGDKRTNQNPDLAVLSIVFMREHNRLAKELSILNPKWDDEQLYQEARNINIAQAQHITYSEYIQHIMGQMYIEGLKMESLQTGFTEYDPKLMGGTMVEFTGSIFRTFHSTVQGEYKLFGGGNKQCPMKSIKLRDVWWTSGDIGVTCFEEIAKGFMAQEARLYKSDFTVDESQLFQIGNKPYGDDLPAIDIMRGRDQGISTYNSVRKVCNLTTFSTFQQLKSVMKPKVTDKLMQLYSDVDDIDLYVGVLLEKPVSPGLTGPTGQCVLAQQFARWKFGDRFYYEHSNQTGSFTSQQLDAIRTVTFSSLMCRNTKIKRIQKNGFNKISPKDPQVSCEDIPAINLTAWKD